VVQAKARSRAGLPAREKSLPRWSKEKTRKIPMYKILGADQKEYGPVNAEQIRQWLAENRINGQTQVQAEGSTEWKALSQFAEFNAALAGKGSAVPPQPPRAAPPSLPAANQPSTGLAVASMVLGILSLVSCSIFTGIPAIITGHLARGRARKSPSQYAGRGMATAGLVLGYVSLAFIPILAGLMLPALAKAKEKAQRIQCVNNMKQISLAARIWATNHGDKFPPDFNAMSNELATPKLLICPSDPSKSVTMDWPQFGPDNVSYEFLEPDFDELNSAPGTVIFQCPIHGNLALADGSVQQGRGFRR
jgi:hypothetical protein